MNSRTPGQDDAAVLAAAIYGDTSNATIQKIYRLARLDLIPHVRLGRTVRFDLDAYRRFAALGGANRPGAWRQMLASERVAP